MSSRPLKRLKRQASGNKNDETEKLLSTHKEGLQEKMMAFLDGLPQLVARFQEQQTLVQNDHTAVMAEQKDLVADAVAAAAAPPVKEAKDLPRLPCNEKLMGHLAVLKAEAFLLSKQIMAIAEWITLMVPAIKDEDNAGVEVQMQVHGELVSLAKEVEGKYDLEFEYIEARAGAESKYFKYFLAPTWRLCIQKMDLSRWDDLTLAWKELIRIVLTAYTLLSNNMEKLKNPRNTASSSFMTM